MIAILILLVSIPLTALLMFVTVFFYRKGYKALEQTSKPLTKAFTLMLFSLPFNIILAFYLTGVLLYFSNGLKNGMEITTIIMDLIISLFIGTINVAGSFMLIFDPHDGHSILKMFNLSSSFFDTLVTFTVIVVVTFCFWLYKFRKVKLELD